MKECHLTDLYQSFKENFNYSVRSGIELEFYLPGDESITESVFRDCIAIFENKGIKTDPFQKESEEWQYEISVGPYDDDPLRTAQHAIEVKNILTKVVATYNTEITFAAKPFAGKAGNGMHVHISVLDQHFRNLFEKGINEKQETDELLFAIAGLCATMTESMIFFAPNIESYKRFEKDNQDSFFPYSFVPINVSWGGNNRTVAIRIAESSSSPQNRHLEHRVAGSDADPLSVVFAVLAGIYHGLRKREAPKVEKHWGNAYDENNDFEKLPVSRTQAAVSYKNGRILPQLITGCNNEDLMKPICQI